jgi:hypothetical protein
VALNRKAGGVNQVERVSDDPIRVVGRVTGCAFVVESWDALGSDVKREGVNCRLVGILNAVSIDASTGLHRWDSQVSVPGWSHID